MRLVIAGTGGHSESVFDLTQSLGHEVVGFLDNVTNKTNWNGIPIFKNMKSLSTSFPFGMVVAVGNGHLREKIVTEIQQTTEAVDFPNMVHPSAVVSASAKIGIGNVVMPFAHIGPKSTVGNFCIINTHSSIDHDSKIGAYVSIAPGVIMGGNVTIQNYTFIGIGSKVSHKIHVGEDSVIGAGSLLNKNLPDKVVAYGSPASVVGENV
jgi:sugar O-acyltransferase (sialic acid O-acetyltransferase NeuD family)